MKDIQPVGTHPVGRIAVSITREYGERTIVTIHPHIDSEGKLVTIAEYIKKNYLSESN